MKYIVILTCPLAEDVCTGAGCFSALNKRRKAFAPYEGTDVELEAFMKCSGCNHFPKNDKGLREKIDRILEIHPDAVHLGICCCHDGKAKGLCPEVSAICDQFRKAGISVINGTHSVF